MSCRASDNGLVAESWMIDELAHAGPEHLDPDFVAGYDRKQGYPDPAEDLDAFAAHGLGPASAVVDLGAGSGQFALAVSFAVLEHMDLGYARRALPEIGRVSQRQLHQVNTGRLDVWRYDGDASHCTRLPL